MATGEGFEEPSSTIEEDLARHVLNRPRTHNRRVILARLTDW